MPEDVTACEGGLSRIERNARGDLVAHFNDGREAVSGVKLARCFPWTLPDGYVSVRNGDGREVALLASLDSLDAATRALVLAELRDKVLTPRITRVIEFRQDLGLLSMRVETDRGETAFQLRGRDAIRLLSPSRALVRDADGITYEIEDVAALDRSSRELLAEYF